jgi:hypothetical protein
MSVKKLITLLAVMAVFLSACGAQGEPTLSPQDVEGTAVAAAWTMVAMTQEAIPTATEIPPTETPSPTPEPTFTLEPLPTLEEAFPTATQAASSGTNPCLGPINFAQAGPTSRIRIENDTGGTFTISLNLSTNAHGQCGAVSYQLSRNERMTVSLPRGDWWAYAWIVADGANSTASCRFTLRPADTDLIRLVVQKNTCRDLP